MSDWIPFENATYLVEQAFLVADDNTAALLERTSIEVYTGRDGKKHLKGSGLVQNVLLVELFEFFAERSVVPRQELVALVLAVVASAVAVVVAVVASDQHPEEYFVVVLAGFVDTVLADSVEFAVVQFVVEPVVEPVAASLVELSDWEPVEFAQEPVEEPQFDCQVSQSDY